MFNVTGVAGAEQLPNSDALSQNIFDYAAQQALSTQGTGPSEIGSKLIGTLDGFVERNARFDILSDASNPMNLPDSASQFDVHDIDSFDNSDDVVAEKSSLLEPLNFDHMVNTLGRVFDHAAETQLISTGATQVSSSVSSLLHGR